MFDLIAALLDLFYRLIPSYGFAIIMLTLVIMTIIAPLTVRQTRSMLAMQRLAPEVKKLRTKYAGDRERMNQEMMALYQANGVNPLGGCLPLLVQMPVLLVMYQVIQGLTRRVSDVGLSAGYFTSHVSGSVGDLPMRPFNPAYLGADWELHDALEGATTMDSFGLDLSQSARGVLSGSFVEAIPYLALVIAVGVTTFIQQRQISSRAKRHGTNPQADDKMMQQQQAILKVMPFLVPVFSFNFAAGLVLYWFVSNLFRVGQQAFITRRVYGSGNDGTDIILPPSDPDDDEGAPARPKPAPSAGGHGSRRPVTQTPKPKPKKKQASSTSASRRTTPSKRVTPKQSGPNRRGNEK